MTLYLLRHGKADWPEWAGEDDDRPLTAEGKQELKKIGEALRELKVEPRRILTSPLPRAAQTAEIAGRELGVVVREEEALRPGFEGRQCRKLLAAHPGDLMLVGHEPDFSGIVAALTGGEIKLPKGGVAAIELDRPEGEGRLLWLLPAKLLIRLYR